MTEYKLRKASDADIGFLTKVHHTTLRPHVEKIWGWEDSLQDEFLLKDYQTGLIQVIELNGTSVGYLQLNQEVNTLSIVNILILPEFQGQQLGSSILKDLIVVAKDRGDAVRLGVFKVNTRARDLYLKLGFKIVGETQTHHLMQI